MSQCCFDGCNVCNQCNPCNNVCNNPCNNVCVLKRTSCSCSKCSKKDKCKKRCPERERVCAPQTFANSRVFNAPGSFSGTPQSFGIPNGVCKLFIEAVGAGGAGAAGTATNGGGGGGAGSLIYGMINFPDPNCNTQLNITVGSGSNPLASSSTVSIFGNSFSAGGGSAGSTTGTGGTGGLASGCGIFSTSVPGLAGSNGGTIVGGNGGTGPTGAVYGLGGQTTGAMGGAGSSPGAGGGGGAASGLGNVGGNGQVIIHW